MSPAARPNPAASAAHRGLLDWRLLVQWLKDDAVISAEEAQRTIARCSQAESATARPIVASPAAAIIESLFLFIRFS